MDMFMAEKGFDSESSSLVDAILHSTQGYEKRVFDLYVDRLTQYASTRMPNKLNPRVDSDDIVQSVFRSFFRRNREGEFSFDDSLDIWKLLIAMTYRKVINQVRHHTRGKRDVGKEGYGSSGEGAERQIWHRGRSRSTSSWII